MQKRTLPTVLVIIAFILVSIIAVSNVSFAHPFATKYVTVTAKNDPGGVVQITYTYNGITYGPYNTTSVETIKIPEGASVTFTAIPLNGFGFYGWNYSFIPYSAITSSAHFTFSSSQTLTFNDVTSSITAIAYFPVKLTIIDASIWDYITTSGEYYLSFVGGLAFANNGSLVPSSLVSQNTFTLNVEVKAKGNSSVVSGSVLLIPSGSVLYISNQPLFNIYSQNGLEMKNATITWASPKPWLYQSGTLWSTNDWAWGIAVTIKSGESGVTWTLPFQNLNFQLSKTVPPSTSTTVYFPTGSSPSFYDTPLSGYACVNWYMIESNILLIENKYTSTSNPWTFNLPSTSFVQAYTGPWFTLEPNVVQPKATFDVSAPIWDAEDNVSLTLTFPNGSKQTQTQFFKSANILFSYAVATFEWKGIPMGSYSWNITPVLLVDSLFGSYNASANPSSGSFTLSSGNNGTFEQGITYLGHTYTVTFNETGLPNGITWWAKLGSVTEQATTPNPIVFTGAPQDTTLSYSVMSSYASGETKYQALQASGTISVGDQNVTQQISYLPYYAVNVFFNPNYGTSNPPSVWVPAGGQQTFELTPEEDYYIAQPYSSSITASSGITINYNSISTMSSGNTYVYSVPVTVNAPGNITVSLTWFNFINYISESGLPNGQTWNYVIYQNGQQQYTITSLGSPVSIEEPGYDYSTNNYYQYTITFPVIQAGNVYYVPTSISMSAVDVLSKTSNSVTFEITGNTENNTNIITVNYVPYYAVTINAGQGGSVSWSLVSGYVYGSSSGTVSAGQSQNVYITWGTKLQLTDNPNSGYRFTQWSLSGYVRSAEGYSSNNNPIVIQNIGSTGSVTANYQVYLNMISNPSGAGSLSPSSGWYNVGTQVQISASPNSGYKFVSWSGSGSSSYTGTNNPETITLNSPVNETANFDTSITFSANGLNNNAQGTVLTVNGQSYTYSQLPLTIYVSPGSSVSFSWISPISGGSSALFVWTSTSGLSTSQSGTITISTPGSVTASYSDYYALTINAGSGGSVSWSVLPGMAYVPGIGFTHSGTVNTGQSLTVYIKWTAELQLTDNPNSGYTFTQWSFSNTTPETGYYSNSNPIVIELTNNPGSVTANYHYSTYIQFTVSAPVDISYTITLSNGQSKSGNTYWGSSTVTFYLPYGTYSWSISPKNTTINFDGYLQDYVAMPSSSSATTNASVSINYVLSSSTYQYTWSESGLPSGTQWGVNVGGTQYTTTSSSLTETFSTGQTYSWSVINPSGYVGTPSSGSFSSPGSQSIAFYTTPSVSINANPSSGSSPLTVTFVASASGGSGNYEYNFYYMGNSGNYHWSGWQTSNTFTYTYNSNGVYYAMVEVEDTVTGATAESNYAQVTVAPPPLSVTISAYPTQGSAPLQVSFASNVQGGSGSYSYYWTFGDGGTSTSANPTHTYTSPGTYNVQLEVTSGSQTASSNTITITVTKEQLQASISANPTSGTAPLSVTFTASASGGSGGYSYSWNFGDGSSSTSQNPTHTYNSAGTYTATVTVKDSTGASKSASIKITVGSTYSYTFSESNLPSGVTWSVTMNGNTQSANAGDSITFTGLSGSNSWSAPNVVVFEGPPNHKVQVTYYPNPSSGKVSGSGSTTISYST